MIEVNSLEFYDVFIHYAELGEAFGRYDRLEPFDRFVVKMRRDGKTFLVCDDPPNTSRRRTLEEVLAPG